MSRGPITIDMWPAGNAADGTTTYSSQTQALTTTRAELPLSSAQDARDAIVAMGVTFLVGGAVCLVLSAVLPRE
jgi:hypothetical protein